MGDVYDVIYQCDYFLFKMHIITSSAAGITFKNYLIHFLWHKLQWFEFTFVMEQCMVQAGKGDDKQGVIDLNKDHWGKTSK